MGRNSVSYTMTQTPNIISVAAEHAGHRLDRILSALMQDVSRARVQGWIKDGHVILRRRGEVVDTFSASSRLQEGDEMSVSPPPIQETKIVGQDIDLDILYEDDDIIVLHKPAGMVVHPAPGNPDNTLVNALISYCGDSLAGIGGERRPGIVHRLDKDTSGIMVVAKTDAAHIGLSEQFKAHGRDGRLRRAYHAYVWGAPLPAIGTVETYIGRAHHNRLKMGIVPSQHGRIAITHYRRLSTSPGDIVSKLVCELETGRTHQIRVHMTHLGHSVVGDELYGSGMRSRVAKLEGPLFDAISNLKRQALHAWLLGFEHPITGETMEFEAGLPDDLLAIDAALTQKK
jgi:23S rRNA pseudouridine1911/1915/1917 synthase